MPTLGSLSGIRWPPATPDDAAAAPLPTARSPRPAPPSTPGEDEGGPGRRPEAAQAGGGRPSALSEKPRRGTETTRPAQPTPMCRRSGRPTAPEALPGRAGLEGHPRELLE